jgi:TetR/AcrR family transcriptional repressor of nem operon
MQDLERIPNSIDKLKHFIANFIERRPVVPGGCPLLNTAIDADDGNEVLRDRVRAALRQWRDSVSGIVETGIKHREIRQGVDPKEVATIIISSLEGALMVARLERKKDALLTAQSFLAHYFDTELRVESTSRS